MIPNTKLECTVYRKFQWSVKIKAISYQSPEIFKAACQFQIKEVEKQSKELMRV